MPDRTTSSSLSKEELGQLQPIRDLVSRSKAIFFDHNDTLVEAIKSKWAQHKYIARKFYGKKLTDSDLRAHWGQPFTLLLKLLYGTDHIDIAMTYNIATRPLFPKLLFKDTIEVLKSLRSSGKKVGLMTATTLSSLNNDFDTLHVSKRLFDYIQTEDDTIFHKPDPRVFGPALKWLEKHHIKPHETVYVGDQLKDLFSAKGAGLEFIGMTTGIVTAEEFQKHGVLSISKLSELNTNEGAVYVI